MNSIGWIAALLIYALVAWKSAKFIALKSHEDFPRLDIDAGDVFEAWYLALFWPISLPMVIASSSKGSGLFAKTARRWNREHKERSEGA